MNCIAKARASQWVETWCRNGVEELHYRLGLPSHQSSNLVTCHLVTCCPSKMTCYRIMHRKIFLRSGHACTERPSVATEFRHEKWQMSPNQMPPCILCIMYVHSKVFLRSGQACTVRPGVAREFRSDQCQMSPNQIWPAQRLPCQM